MKIRHLKIYKTVCEEESITKAAEKLYISQPAVSNVINELESHLGVKLFDRISRKIHLNETGELFLAKTIKLLELYDDLENSIDDLEDMSLIKIGSSITIATFILPRAILDFEKEYKNIPINVMVSNALEIEEKLCNNEIDLGLIEGVISNENLIKIPFSSYELIVIASPNNKLVDKENVELSELIEERLLLREKGSAIRDMFDSKLLLNNLTVNPTWTSINSQSLIAAVKNNLGVSVLPRVLVENEISRGEVVELKVNNLELININQIVFHKDKFQTKGFKYFVDLVKNMKI